MLSAEEAFRAGFIARCLERGLTADQINAVAEKTANDKEPPLVSLPSLGGLASGLWSGVSGGLGLARDAVSTIGPLATGALITAPVVGGLGAGYALAKGEDSLDQTEADELLNEDLANAYRQATEQLRMKARLRAAHDAARKRPVRRIP